MRRIKQVSHFILLANILCLVIIFAARPAQAADSVNWYQWPTSGQAVQLDKVWQIQFNQQVDVHTVNSSDIYILDNNGVQYDAKLSLSSDGTTISVTPAKPYQAGNNYRLLINNLKSINGKTLSKPVSLSFQTVNTAIDTSTLNGAILDAFDKVKLSVDVSKFNKTSAQVSTALNQVLNDHPEYEFYYGEASISYAENTGLAKSLNLSYLYDVATIENMRTTLDTKINQIIQTETQPAMSSFTKEVALHDYVVKHTVYDINNFNNNNVPHLDYTGYGVLINGSGVCQGYAQAMKLLLNKIGIECMIVTGNAGGESHAWNIVNIDGAYYHLDTTWDDPVPDGGDRVSYAYFNLPDSLISKDHVWEKTDYPACTSMIQNYYYQNGLYVKTYDDFYNLIQKTVTKRGTELTVMIANYDPAVYDLAKALQQAGFQGEYQYQVNASLGIITLLNVSYSN